MITVESIISISQNLIIIYYNKIQEMKFNHRKRNPIYTQTQKYPFHIYSRNWTNYTKKIKQTNQKNKHRVDNREEKAKREWKKRILEGSGDEAVDMMDEMNRRRRSRWVREWERKDERERGRSVFIVEKLGEGVGAIAPWVLGFWTTRLYSRDLSPNFHYFFRFKYALTFSFHFHFYFLYGVWS